MDTRSSAAAVLLGIAAAHFNDDDIALAQVFESLAEAQMSDEPFLGDLAHDDLTVVVGELRAAATVSFKHELADVAHYLGLLAADLDK